jgi:hypothetical protein
MTDEEYEDNIETLKRHFETYGDWEDDKVFEDMKSEIKKRQPFILSAYKDYKDKKALMEYLVKTL